jgi:adenylate kinase
VRLVLMGPPGSGKGTQAKKLSERFGIPTISFGEVFDDQISRQTELGKKAQEHVEKGDLVPDEIVLDMARERLSEDDCSDGFLLDGFPRTEGQAKALQELLDERNEQLDAAIYLDVADEVVVDRIAKRSGEEGRSDDDEETVRNRLNVFEESTKPLREFYEDLGLLVDIDADGEIDEVGERILAGLKADQSNS